LIPSLLWRSCSSGRTAKQTQKLPSAREIFEQFDFSSREGNAEEEEEKVRRRREEDDEEMGEMIHRELSDLTTTDEESSTMPRVFSDVVLAPEELPTEPEFSPEDLAPLSDTDTISTTRSTSCDQLVQQPPPHYHPQHHHLHHRHHHRPHRHPSHDDSHRYRQHHHGNKQAEELRHYY